MHPDDHELDRLLNSALAQYGKAEPRSGLEGRIMANLQAEQQRADSRRHWQWWSFGLAATAALVALVWWVAIPAKRVDPHEVAKNEQVHYPQEPFLGNQKKEDRVMRAADSPKAKPPHHQDPARVEAVAAKQDLRRPQFPTPAPLSPQEQLLARYVNEFPDAAVSTARAQTAMQKADELAWNTPPEQPN
jgi:hypothetical protein